MSKRQAFRWIARAKDAGIIKKDRTNDAGDVQQ
jgi:hypothetical protein